MPKQINEELVKTDHFNSIEEGIKVFELAVRETENCDRRRKPMLNRDLEKVRIALKNTIEYFLTHVT